MANINQNVEEWIGAQIPFSFEPSTVLVFVAILVAIIILKGTAMWKAARKGSKGWFWAILIVNSAGILPLLYHLHFSKK